MATYYVRTDGSDINAGTGPATNQAWQTITKAIGATGIAPGDTLYIAPGVYRESVTAAFTNPTSEGQRITISGDPTASQFTGVSAGPVVLTNYVTNTSANSSGVLEINKSYVTLQNLHITGYRTGGDPLYGTIFQFVGTSNVVTACGFYTPANNVDFSFAVRLTPIQSTAGFTVSKCIFLAPVTLGSSQLTSAFDSQSSFKDCVFINPSVYTPSTCLQFFSSGGAFLGGITVQNCRFIGYIGIAPYPGNNLTTTYPTLIRNCIFETSTGITSNTNNGQIVESYNIFNCGTPRNNVGTGTGSTTRAFISPDYNLSRVTGWGNFPFWANHSSSASQNAGTSTGAPATDIYGVTWLAPSTPTIGAIEYSDSVSTGRYVPTERNSSTITIAPGETSRSLYLYLGATGLTHTTTNLTASYTRNGQASVPITVVAQTPTGSYVSGGFCEVSAPYARGTYRLDVPNAAFDFGADDVTIFVGGANTTNGAVVTCNMQGIAGNIVHIGPFKVIADGLGSDQPLDIVQGVQAPVSVQLVDANENGVDISGATVEAKVYNAIGSLIATYSCVPVYAADGRCTFQLTTSVTNTAGVYNVTLTRTIGGNIVVFGPMKMIVRAN
jgi:hypothetical protein